MVLRRTSSPIQVSFGPPPPLHSSPHSLLLHLVLRALTICFFISTHFSLTSLPPVISSTISSSHSCFIWSPHNCHSDIQPPSHRSALHSPVIHSPASLCITKSSTCLPLPPLYHCLSFPMISYSFPLTHHHSCVRAPSILPSPTGTQFFIPIAHFLDAILSATIHCSSIPPPTPIFHCVTRSSRYLSLEPYLPL